MAENKNNRVKDINVKTGQGSEKRDSRRKKEELPSRLLPNNYRQIGEPGSKKIYIEDYVYTYLNRLAQPGNLYARGAILFGKMYKTPAGPSLFISGAAACQSIEFDLNQTVFSEEVWQEIYKTRETWFPDLAVCGWFLSRMGFSVDLNDKIIRLHMDNFSGEAQVLYMMDTLENEDAFYRMDHDVLKKQKGYYIYYETNHAMADYMLAEGEKGPADDRKRPSGELQRDSALVRNYKNILKKKKIENQKNKPGRSPVKVAGAVVVIMALIYGAYSVGQFRRNESVKAVFEQPEILWEDSFTDTEEADGTGGAAEAAAGKREEGTDPAKTSAAETEEAVKDQEESRETMADGERDADVLGDIDEETDSGSVPQTAAGDREEDEEDLETGAESAEGDDKSDGQDEEADPDGDDSEKADSRAASSGTGRRSTEKESGKDPEDLDVFSSEEPDDLESWAYLGGEYTVKKGDTLAGISMEIYDSYAYIQKLAEVNNIEDVDRIYPGQVLKIPRIDDEIEE